MAEYYSAIEKEGNDATTWMNQENVTLSEISQSQKDKYSWFHLYEVWQIVVPNSDTIYMKYDK